MTRKMKSKYCIYVIPEDGESARFSGVCFASKKKAVTYANIESVAGMGEDYIVRKAKGKKR